MDFWYCKCYIDFPNPTAEMQDREQCTFLILAVGCGNPWSHKVRQVAELGGAANAVLNCGSVTC